MFSKSYPAVMELRDLEGHAAEEFHDFRKRARSVVKIADDMTEPPDAFIGLAALAEGHRALETLSEREGFSLPVDW